MSAVIESTPTVSEDASRPCPSCGHGMRSFFRLEGVPVNSCLLVSTREQAVAFPRGDIDLRYCPGCGFVSNRAFDPHRTEYSGRYEETQAYSATFNEFHRQLAADLVQRLHLHGRTIVEVGCGKGEFLALLCSLGGNHGVGFDPSFDPQRDVFGPGTDVRVVRDFFGPATASLDADLLCCKMTLEHIPETAGFVTALRSALRPGDDSMVFIQVPESLRILRDCAFEDIYYEHCSYFTPGSLARLFRGTGFAVARLTTTYGGQYLTLEGRAVASPGAATLPAEEPPEEVVQLASTFAERFRQKSGYWQEQVERASAGGAVAVWGSGSKAVAFLHAIGSAGRSIEHVVDINPHRRGHYVPGTGQRILSPADLRAVGPRTVIAMNPIYRDEIAAELARQDIEATLLTL